MSSLPGAAKTQRPYAKAFAWGGLWLVALTVGFTIAYGHFSAEGFGRFVAMTGVPALLVGYLAKRSSTAWGFWKIGAVYVVAAIAFVLISSYGAMQHKP